MNYFLVFILINFPGFLLSQKSEPQKLKVEYTFSHSFDAKDSARKIETDVLLLIGESTTRFYNARNNETAYNEFFLNPPNIVFPGSATNSTSDIGQPIESIDIYVDPRGAFNEYFYFVPHEKKLVIIRHIGLRDYRVSTEIPKIDWEIHDDTKDIQGIICQKATGWYKGREYIAWFAPSIPFPYGPWKINGLPGLILESYDSSREIQFIFKRLDTAKDREYLYYEALRPVDLPEKDLYKIIDRFHTDPYNFAKSQYKEIVRNVNGIFIDLNGNYHSGEAGRKMILENKDLKITNPIEKE